MVPQRLKAFVWRSLLYTFLLVIRARVGIWLLLPVGL